MPIVDVELVYQSEVEVRAVSAQAIADALGKSFGDAPGGTWVRIRFLSSTAYAENDAVVSSSELPVFVTVLHAQPPTGPSLVAEVAAVTSVVAQCVSRLPERVHVQYAPAAAGRQAFGGRLVETRT